jgi:hypothetical protein
VWSNDEGVWNLDPEAQTGICPPITAITPSSGHVSSVGTLTLKLSLKPKPDKRCTSATVIYEIVPKSSADTGPAAALAATPASETVAPVGKPVQIAVPVPVGATELTVAIPYKNSTGKPATLKVKAFSDTPPPATASFDVDP